MTSQKEENDSNVIAVGDFNTTISITDRISTEKINKQLNNPNIYRISTQHKNTHSSQAYTEVSPGNNAC